MQVFKDWNAIAAAARGSSVAMGNFDGVHLGHQSVIALARRAAPLGVVTFEPHPREFFSPGAARFFPSSLLLESSHSISCAQRTFKRIR